MIDRFHLTTVALITALALCTPPAFAEMAPEKEKGYLEQDFRIGYRIVDPNGKTARASEYDSQNSSVTASAGIVAGGDASHFHLDLDFLDQDDYRGDGHADYKGLLRLDLFTDAFVHNLDHIPYRGRPEATSEVKTVVSFGDEEPRKEYEMKLEEYGGRFRAKHPDIPVHINVGYWRQERSGDQQMRFVQEGTTPGADPVTAVCNQCHLQSKTRHLDQVTQEVTAGFDSHLGPIDLIYEFLVREFRDDQGIPVDQFGQMGNGRRAGGDFQHDEAPDSKLVSSTVKAHTSLSGGVIGAASFTLGQRENHSKLTDVQGVKSETDFMKTAGDLSLTPFSQVTLNFRYRLLDLDNTNSETITAAGLPATGALPLEVRDNPDQTRTSYETELAWRPVRALTLKGQYRREEIHRGNTGPATKGTLPTSPDPYWELPEDEVVDTYKVSLFSRMLSHNRLKINAWYQYRTSDEPAYGNSADSAQEAFAGATWTPTRRVAFSVNARAKQEENNKHQLTRFNAAAAAPPETVTFNLDRSAEDSNFTGSLWLQPADPLSLTFNYGYLRSKVTQDLLFGTSVNTLDPASNFVIEDEDVDYRQEVQTASISAIWQLTRTLRFLAEGRHIRSEAHFDPRAAATGLTFSGFTPPTSVDTSGLRQLSQLDIRQNGLSGELAWDPAEGWGVSARYTYDDYDDRDTGLYEGKVQTYLASLSRSW